MSLCFSITISTSVATMLSAATATISPIAIPTATFSIQSAEYSAWFISTQSRGHVPAAEPLQDVARALLDREHVVEPDLDVRGAALLVEQPPGRLGRQVAPRRVELVEARLDRAHDARPLHAREHAERREPPARRGIVTTSPTPTLSVSASAVPSRIGGMPRAGLAELGRAALTSFETTSVTVRSSAGTMPLSVAAAEPVGVESRALP